MSFSDLLDIVIIIMGCVLTVLIFISMHRDNKNSMKFVKAMADTSIKTLEQNKLLETQNALLQEEIKILKKENAE